MLDEWLLVSPAVATQLREKKRNMDMVSLGCISTHRMRIPLSLGLNIICI